MLDLRIFAYLVFHEFGPQGRMGRDSAWPAARGDAPLQPSLHHTPASGPADCRAQGPQFQ